MNLFLTLAFLFFIGSITGWVVELLFRRFVSSSNPERKWINPGFCTGPYLPIYGIGLCVYFLIASLENKTFISNPFWEKVVLFIWMTLCMTAIEYIAGVVSFKILKVRLWDYTDEWGNLNGYICPKFSLAWTLLGAVYYFLIHPHILNALNWLAQNLVFSFVIGLFYGVFIVDLCRSVNLLGKLKQFANENDVVIRLEALKSRMRSSQERAGEKYHFFRPFQSHQDLHEHLQQRLQEFEKHGMEHGPSHAFIKIDPQKGRKKHSQ